VAGGGVAGVDGVVGAGVAGSSYITDPNLASSYFTNSDATNCPITYSIVDM
jgi:hypothetical protein